MIEIIRVCTYSDWVHSFMHHTPYRKFSKFVVWFSVSLLITYGVRTHNHKRPSNYFSVTPSRATSYVTYNEYVARIIKYNEYWLPWDTYTNSKVSCIRYYRNTKLNIYQYAYAYGNHQILICRKWRQAHSGRIIYEVRSSYPLWWDC